MLNEVVLELLKLYPTDGSHRYHWVDGFDGVTTNILYQGEIVAKAEEEMRTYCCGLTFEVYMLAAQLRARQKNVPLSLGGMTSWGVRKMKADWFVATGLRGGPFDALVSRDLGKRIEYEEALAGDFIQLWRYTGSGHSCILIDRDADGFRYWSTQPSTNGIGYRRENFRVIKRDELYITRAFDPTS